MANLMSIARPYALAAFEYASANQQLPEWSAFLKSAAEMIKQPGISRLLENPEMLPSKQYDFFESVLLSVLDDKRKNFLRLLAQSRRLIVLPEIAEAFSAYYASYLKVSKVRVTTAVEVQDDFREKLGQALSKRVERSVTLECEVDPTILGGAIIRIGDRVIDGSIRGKLNRMLQSLTG
jgi:F-type H+-transporting ATPase subunit delta